jgi:tRNA(adenine34) deaminase
MQALRPHIRGCPSPVLIEQGGHFVQEHGQAIAQQALRHFSEDRV